MSLLKLTSHSGKAPFTDLHSGSFNGTTSAVDVPNATNLNPTTSFSVTVWVKATADAEEGVVAKTDFGNNKRQFYVEKYFANTAKVGFLVSQSGGFNAGGSMFSSGTAFDNTWHHIACTYGNATGTFTMKIYIDGALDTTNNTSVPTSIASQTVDFSLGYMYNNGAKALFYNGKMDDVWYFSNELTSAQVTSIYNSGTPKDNSAIGTPVSAWLFENTTKDFVDGNNGTATAITYSTDVP